MSKAIVVFSGGQDSTTCLLWALKLYDEVETITFSYNQRHKQEIEVAKKISKDFGVKNQVIDASVINELTVNALTRDMDIDVDNDTGLPNTFVPGRNILFLTLASVVAYQRKADTIVTGVCETDFSGYPDCRNEFVRALEPALQLGLDKNITIKTPLMWLNKAETWELAANLGHLEYVVNNTLTCYNGVIGQGCGDCPACKLRRKGLEEFIQKHRKKLN
ncbi:TPA: 7-cyano-7-deazaguanine synthase QueC [Staphylococcus pseudintermedius]|uniref:7-cyano-7-deazaguanine synthase QueC n=1 Tax=Staphylococcus pseudintermedius TaxID=283734 RepID=UPI001932DB99|nr:7-cyano-7-deazaguanine synthase QueC [Staphylococcus pseudintermedius]EGQ2753904.1 7-cyano-7-deazaguanine synthase QueC [Staphylococcus pseudintermedius]EII2289691.1 7-cyano-7-deazaguanine synthase QueC [Staphylococcus pseudintermedius]EII2697900.1 7-cyano-7-deazaguanine synthase QueC [Staphylococcus pseudintermedius]EJL8084791.1 7-cyano-7-deazaguanine synthase QueC [Staphylococcus pseudintermedius]ELD8084892.1 7-cyano-7-deazaguanine synthase QueC [Staphylococcus pseudintermedius]